MDDNAFVGIDLGTSYCCLAIFRQSKWEVVKLEDECNRMPSYVRFTDDDILVGSDAKTHMFENIGNTVFNIKRLLGRKKTDSNFYNQIEHLNYKVDTNMDKFKVLITKHNVERKLSPEEIAALLLMRMKYLAEEKLGKAIQSLTISVPTSFYDSQRQATIDAASIAGFTNVKLLNDTVAVTLKYMFEENNNLLSLIGIADSRLKKGHFCESDSPAFQ
ncbi:heat shock protein 70-like protein [Leptotrombidium deliense]|uniref:Heat shock protein 70-like protein n=1 Tax=Leptotrombidium deliense TaxID=299467 RepID=A0A443RV57_9ACAR|nr:heat shock protein 70-like protein [Leptotrombidium deliense]